MLLELVIDRLRLIDLSWISHELLLRLGIGGWHRLRLSVAWVSRVGSIEHTLNWPCSHIRILKCHNLCVKISNGTPMMINLELRLRVGDRDGRTGGDVHMGQHSIDELHILAWI